MCVCLRVCIYSIYKIFKQNYSALIVIIKQHLIFRGIFDPKKAKPCKKAQCPLMSSTSVNWNKFSVWTNHALLEMHFK